MAVSLPMVTPAPSLLDLLFQMARQTLAAPPIVVVVEGEEGGLARARPVEIHITAMLLFRTPRTVAEANHELLPNLTSNEESGPQACHLSHDCATTFADNGGQVISVSRPPDTPRTVGKVSSGLLYLMSNATFRLREDSKNLRSELARIGRDTQTHIVEAAEDHFEVLQP
jgi:hypothetical protein